MPAGSGCNFFSLNQTTLFHAQVTGFCNDDMINKLDAEKYSSLFQLSCDRDVLWAGIERTRRVIVNADDGRRPVRDCIGKHLPRMDKTVVEQTQGYRSVAENFTGAIEGDTDEMLLPLFF